MACRDVKELEFCILVHHSFVSFLNDSISAAVLPFGLGLPFKINFFYSLCASWLVEFQVVRYNELKRYIGTISDKTLSMSLKELEEWLKKNQ